MPCPQIFNPAITQNKPGSMIQSAEKCTQRTMGLVGLHIVSKTPARPQWIWSTFEQVDNVPVVTGATPTSNTAIQPE